MNIVNFESLMFIILSDRLSNKGILLGGTPSKSLFKLFFLTNTTMFTSMTLQSS